MNPKRTLHRLNPPAQVALATALLLMAFSSPAWAQLAAPQLGTIKVGMNRTIFNGATYKVEDDAGTVSGSESGSMSGTDVFIEYILFGRFGVEASTTLSRPRRSFELNDGTATLMSEVEDRHRTSLFGLNVYLNDHAKGGLKYYFGLATGETRVTRNLGGSGTLSAFNGTYQDTVPVETLKLGVDWILEKAGIRVQYISMTGSATDRNTLTGYNETVSYDATVLAIGAFAFF